MLRTLITAVLLLGLSACAKPIDPPAEVYLEYHARTAEGMTLEEDASYFSKAVRAEIESRISSLVERTGRSREEAIALYLDVSQKSAQCTRLELEDETIEEKTANLVFAVHDTCQDDSRTTSRHKVRLVLEDGWKLDDVEIVL